jgi:hypothetical protein
MVTDEQIFGGSTDDIVVDGVEEGRGFGVEMDRLNKRRRDRRRVYYMPDFNGLARFKVPNVRKGPAKGMQTEEDQRKWVEDTDMFLADVRKDARVPGTVMMKTNRQSDEEDDDGFGRTCTSRGSTLTEQETKQKEYKERKIL